MARARAASRGSKRQGYGLGRRLTQRGSMRPGRSGSRSAAIHSSSFRVHLIRWIEVVHRTHHPDQHGPHALRRAGEAQPMQVASVRAGRLDHQQSDQVVGDLSDEQFLGRHVHRLAAQHLQLEVRVTVSTPRCSKAAMS